MRKIKLLLTLAFCVFAANANSQTFTYGFTTGYEGWTGDFADYSENDSVLCELEFIRTTLPAPLNTSKYALKITGKNRSDDLFMFIKRKISGLLPNTTYQLLISVDFASIARTNVAGVGGSEGEGVIMKAGATIVEPLKTIIKGYYRMNIDKSDQIEHGSDMDTIGNVGVSDTTSVFTLVNRNNSTHLFVITTDANGEAWVCIGTDSGYEATTTLYYNQITLTFTNTTGFYDRNRIKNDIEIYPDPTSELITLKISPALLNQSYKMIDAVGKEVLAGTLTSEIFKIPVSNLPKGLYVIQVGEEQKQTYKIMKR